MTFITSFRWWNGIKSLGKTKTDRKENEKKLFAWKHKNGRVSRIILIFILLMSRWRWWVRGEESGKVMMWNTNELKDGVELPKKCQQREDWPTLCWPISRRSVGNDRMEDDSRGRYRATRKTSKPSAPECWTYRHRIYHEHHYLPIHRTRCGMDEREKKRRKSFSVDRKVFLLEALNGRQLIFGASEMEMHGNKHFLVSSHLNRLSREDVEASRMKFMAISAHTHKGSSRASH